jgi:lipoyl(octanoyl) transferase
LVFVSTFAFQMEKQKILFKDLGLMEYQAAWNYQEALLKENVSIKVAARNSVISTEATKPGDSSVQAATIHHLLFTEHPPVYTLGKSGDKSNVLMSDEELAANDISFYQTNRGGDITFHGPGQLVGYPILDLEKFYTDIGRYLRNIEEVIILTLQEYGLKGERSAGETGVWLDSTVPGKERKICAIGVRCSRWITMHGFALNVNTELSYFNNIIPCGIVNKQVTSLSKELNSIMDIEEVKAKVKANFENVFEIRLLQ